MQPRVLGRAGVLAMTALLLTTVAAQAETITGDADAVTPGVQGTVNLGTFSPGQDVPVAVAFRLDCSGTSHLDSGQSVRLTPGARTIPPGGSFSVGSLTLVPGAGWPADGVACPAGLPGVTGVLHMVVTAPQSLGTGFRYVFSWNRSVVPTSADDTGVLEGPNPTVTFLLDVSDNTPPTLNLPADFTIEGNTTGGALAAYTVSASDAEDAVGPTPSCSPAVGALLPLGTTTVACSATDGGGLTANGSFQITVVDTTAPVLASFADFELTTSDPGGTDLSYGFPGVVEAVDPSPTVACLPANGSNFPVGTTTVTCTATDGSGNHSSMSFHVTVTYVAAMSWTAKWGEPVGMSGDTFTVNRGRAVPIKVEIFANGVEQTSGHAVLTVTPCGGTGGLSLVLVRSSGRWTGKLDTSLLAGPGCYVATVALDGQVAGSFRMDLRGASADATRAVRKAQVRHAHHLQHGHHHPTSGACLRRVS